MFATLICYKNKRKSVYSDFLLWYNYSTKIN
ncbi:hypothetical protein BRC2024_QFGIOCBO_CDS_0155 [Acinetobacter phage vB_AbaM_PhT2-v2]